MEQNKLQQIQEQPNELQKINKNELTQTEWIVYLEVSRLQEKVLYHETFIKELKKDMAYLVKKVKELENVNKA